MAPRGRNSSGGGIGIGFGGIGMGGLPSGYVAGPNQPGGSGGQPSEPVKKSMTIDDWMQMIMSGYQNPGKNGVGTSGIGPAMAFMGLHNMAPNIHGLGAGNNPYAQINRPGATNNGGSGGNGGGGSGSGGGGSGGGGNNTPDDPWTPYPKNLIPDWWKDWYNTTGQYGVVSPRVDGLL